MAKTVDDILRIEKERDRIEEEILDVESLINGVISLYTPRPHEIISWSCYNGPWPGSYMPVHIIHVSYDIYVQGRKADPDDLEFPIEWLFKPVGEQKQLIDALKEVERLQAEESRKREQEKQAEAERNAELELLAKLKAKYEKETGA